MGFTNVAWESRSTEQLARDLTEGPGPTPAGQAGASWVRVANELAAVSEDYQKLADRLTGAFESGSADAVIGRMQDFGNWLRATSLSAAGNGQRAEDAAVAHSVAILAMPTVSEVVEAQTTRDVMASLAAYNGAILNGRFAEFDDAADADQANAAAVMQQYEDACSDFAAPWDQPPPPDTSNGSARAAERAAQAAHDLGSGVGGGGVGGGAFVAPPAPLGAFRVSEAKSSGETRHPSGGAAVSSTSAAAGTGMGGMGGYGPMAAGMGRGDNSREHESALGTDALAGGGEPEAGLADGGAHWLPATATSDAPLLVSNVSWGPTNSALDGLVLPSEPAVPGYADPPDTTLEQVSDHWVTAPVIGRGTERNT
ncbi:PPE domain-containing protein [Mycolicibacterium sp. P1-18]|uniref:PPE domain-containing protein n=1 Tax=Mycolicibacterium sp. P1-18 TaxID=2024615 RepID=UPI0011F2338F|nr:PPE domain-containing protein [Mycolicibacterium sp. P1-18]KAA0096626.1 PPE domain-containing protein [Mycolicibacterium sp. P1-18]